MMKTKRIRIVVLFCSCASAVYFFVTLHKLNSRTFNEIYGYHSSNFQKEAAFFAAPPLVPVDDPPLLSPPPSPLFPYTSSYSFSSNSKRYYDFQHHVHSNHNNNNTASSQNNNNRHNNYKIVDVISIGTKTDNLKKSFAQNKTWGTHQSVRNFWISDETDDENYEDCVKANKKYGKRSYYCRRRTEEMSPLEKYLRVNFARRKWLAKKKNPTGWLCAQKRPLLALAKAARTYQRAIKENSRLKEEEVLPDYLILVDDDTFVNIELIQTSIWLHQQQEEPLVSAGCMIRSPRHMINWTFPFGGYGTFFNRVALQRMMLQPINCSSNNGRKNNTGSYENDDRENDNNNFMTNICEISLKENLLKERKYFKNGLTIIELFEKYLIGESYSDNVTQQDRFCLHSDYSIGYLANFYFLSKHYDVENESDFYKNVRQARLHALDGCRSIIYNTADGNCVYDSYESCAKKTIANNIDNKNKYYNKNRFENSTCTVRPKIRKREFHFRKLQPPHVCHYIDDEQMVSLWEIAK